MNAQFQTATTIKSGKAKLICFAGLVIAFSVGWSLALVFSSGQKLKSSPSAQAKIAENFPTVPIYPQSVLEKSTCNDTQSMLFRSQWQTANRVPEVMSWYLKALQKDGWTVEVVPADPNADKLQYAELTRGIFNSWLGKLQLSVIQNPDHKTVTIETSFPAPDSEKEAEE